MKRMKGKGLIWLLLLVLSVTPLFMTAGQANANEQEESGAEQGAVLASNGVPAATIVTKAAASALEQKAATELANYIKSISGAELPIVTDEGAATGTKIYIGGATPDIDLDAIRQGGTDPDSFRLAVSVDSIRLYGLSDQGTLFAAYELLEQLGVRWFMPGDLGTVIPSKKTITLPIQDTIQYPGFSARAMQATELYQKPPGLPTGVNLTEGKPWVEHMRLNQQFYGTHGIPCTITSKTRPDLFLPNENGTPTNQFDVTKPDVLACVVEGAIKQLQQNPNLKDLRMGPNDGLVKVLYPNPDWDANDWDATHDTLSLTDRYVKFYNLVLDELEKAGYTDVTLSFYAYDTYYQPPVRWTPNPKLIPVIASITVDRYHAIDNPLSWERGHLKDMIDGWRSLGVKPFIYQYLFNLADPGLPYSLVDQVSSEFKYYKQNGIVGIRAENLPAWAYHGPGLYLAAKMMWNPDLDVEALLDDYYTKFYGPAAAAMREHFETLEQAFAQADYFAGNIYDFPYILTDQVMKEMARTLGLAEQAAAVSSDPIYGQRVAMVRTSYNFGDTFLDMIDSINRVDFVKAKAQLDQINALRLEAVLHSPVILNPWASYLYTDTFWKNMVTQGEQLVTGGNGIIAQLPDEWNVMLLPHGRGDLLGLWKPGLGTQSWMKLKTYSETWSSQGLRYYNGHAWYRTEVQVDQKFDKGNPVRLWFSSIDDTARVWMNGQELPLVRKGSGLWKPWEFDATNAIQFGQSNLVVVDVGNAVLDELGTGGITGPVVLWTSGFTPDEVPANKSTLTTPVSTVAAGAEFKVTYGVSDVSKAVYAQDINLEYDTDTIEFVSARSLIDGVSIVETVTEPAGKLRLIVASQGSQHAVTGNAQVIELTFRAKNVLQTASSTISITKALLGDEQTNEVQAVVSSVTITVTADGAGGRTPDINQDGKVSIGDLSFVAAHYGKTNSSPDWAQVKKADINGDGKIDILDLVAVARKIVE